MNCRFSLTVKRWSASVSSGKCKLEERCPGCPVLVAEGEMRTSAAGESGIVALADLVAERVDELPTVWKSNRTVFIYMKNSHAFEPNCPTFRHVSYGKQTHGYVDIDFSLACSG